jgi:Peptidase family M48
MSFLNWPVEELLPSRRVQRRRRRVVLDLLDKYGRAFPQITYELCWESPTINAQAWRLGSARYVRVYGGLVRHQALTKYGLALMLAHETGHHLGGLPHDPAMPWMTWQGQADYWAANIAMPLVWGRSARSMTLRGVREIIELHRIFATQFEDDEPDLSPDCRFSILRAGAFGQIMPSCAEDALSQMSHPTIGRADDNPGLEE